MRTIRYFIAAVAVICAVAACRRDETITYEGLDNIYFSFANLDGHDAATKAMDSVIIMLVDKDSAPLEDSVVEIEVMTMGVPRNYDRQISAVGLDKDEYSNGTAVEGRDYEILPSVLPADSVRGNLKVRVMRTTELDEMGDAGLRLKLKLVDNEYFKTGFTELRDPSVQTDTLRRKDSMDAVHFKILFNNSTSSILWNPSVNLDYTKFVGVFGEFSVAKMNLFIEVSGFGYEYWHPAQDFVITFAPPGMPLPGSPNWNAAFMRTIWQCYVSTLLGGSGDMPILNQTYVQVRAINNYLRLYEEEHGEPMKDENGKAIELGPNGQQYI